MLWIISRPGFWWRPTINHQSPGIRATPDDHFETPEAVFFDEDPFAGEAFIPDSDDPAASVTPVEDFGVPKDDNPLAESTADYAERGRMADSIAAALSRAAAHSGAAHRHGLPP